MRLLPLACGVHWRECEQVGVAIGPDGLHLPVGCDIGMSLFSIFRDGRIFHDPVRFWPERWMAGVLPDADISIARKMFTPFLLGPRNCAGSHVAIRIASIAFAFVLVNYEFLLGAQQPQVPSHIRTNSPTEPGAESDLMFESHYSIAGWRVVLSSSSESAGLRPPKYLKGKAPSTITNTLGGKLPCEPIFFRNQPLTPVSTHHKMGVFKAVAVFPANIFHKHCPILRQSPGCSSEACKERVSVCLRWGNE